MSDKFINFLKDRLDRPLVLIDAGAAGGLIETWKSFGDKMHAFCFEARESEALGLAAANQTSGIEYVPLALSHDKNGIDLIITENSGCSSVYPPVEALYRNYPACSIMRPIGKASCASTTIDDFLTERGIDVVDAIKLDTQGSELDILKSAEKALRTCKLIMLETEFNELYEGQALFCDIDRFLRDRGFVLWRLENLAHYANSARPAEPSSMLIGTAPGRQRMVPVPNGQLFWGDAFYVRKDITPLSAASLPVDDAIAVALLVSQAQFPDLALSAIRKAGDAALIAQAEQMLAGEVEEASAPSGNYRLTLPAADFRSTMIPQSAFSFETDFSRTDACIVFGPYIPVEAGRREVIFHIGTSGLKENLASSIVFDVAKNFARIASLELSGETGAATLHEGKIRLEFDNLDPDGLLEFRLFTYGIPYQGSLSFLGVEIR